ncbi:MAG: histidine phosphatase family protein [Desulfatitalea sp.]
MSAENNHTTIHLVRHGEVHNPRKILYGRLPRFRLSANGRRQARETGQFLGELPLAALFTSPMLRARQTAEEIRGFHPHLALRIDSRLNEVRTTYEGLPGDQVDRRNGDIYTGVSAPFEQPQDIFRRVERFLRRVRAQFAGKQVVAISHGDVITFTVLWAKGWELLPKNKNRLREAGYGAGYPIHASVTSLVFDTTSAQALPDVTYTQPWR